MGVTVTFMALLELVREGLIEIVQAEPFAPLHVRASGPGRTLRVVSDNDTVDSVVPELAIALGGTAPVETVITDLPLDPNFIDDSDADDEPDLEQENVVPPSPDEGSS
jgi:hypothetical protein